jgi:hypothetical protein
VGRAGFPLIFLSLFVPFSYFNHSDGWNQGVRLAELHAIVLKGTIRIDAYHHHTGDKAYINGHYYSEKAPAMVVAALPAFALTVWMQQLLGIDPDGEAGWRVSAWIATAGSVGLLAALGGVAFFDLLLKRCDRLTAVLGTFALFLGSFTWPYATSLFAHAGTIGLLCIALWAALGERTVRRDYIAGLAAGFAVASEYPGVFPCAVLGLYLGYSGVPRMLRYGAGTIPAAVLILANNYLTTGSPFSISYGANPNFPEINTGNAMGFNAPNIDTMTWLVVGEYRGLFYWCPAMILSLAGLVELLRRERAIAAMVIATTLMTLLQVAAFYSASGGNSVAPRYLAPALPLLGLAAAYGAKRWPEPAFVLTAISMVMTLLITAIAIDPPADVLTPMQSFYLVRLRESRFAENLGTVIGLPIVLSLVMPLVFPIVGAWRWLREAANA